MFDLKANQIMWWDLLFYKRALDFAEAFQSGFLGLLNMSFGKSKLSVAEFMKELL